MFSPKPSLQLDSVGSGILMVPSFVLDLLPGLKDSELRVLLVVLSSTVGWLQADGTRKRRDWISHTQFQKRTGRSGQAVSDAIAVLQEAGLLCVTTEKGFSLTSKESRRSYQGPVYYGLTPVLFSAVIAANPWLETSKRSTLESRVGKLENTKQRNLLNSNNMEAHSADGGEGSSLKRPFTPIRINAGWERAGDRFHGKGNR